MIKIIKKIISSIVAVLLVVIFGLSLYNFVSIKVLNKDFTSIGGYTVLEVVSGSMEPTIHIGDMIIVDLNDKDFKKGDIVTFYDVNEAFVTHRIVDINDDLVVTKGDNNNTIDDAIDIDRLIGKYEFRIPGGGRIISSFKSPFTLVMIFIIGILICYLLSMDKDGNLILDEEEKELEEFRKFKEEKLKQEKIEIKEEIVKSEKKEINKISNEKINSVKNSQANVNKSNNKSTKVNVNKKNKKRKGKKRKK